MQREPGEGTEDNKAGIKEKLLYLKKHNQPTKWALGAGSVHSSLQGPGGDFVLLAVEEKTGDDTYSQTDCALE